MQQSQQKLHLTRPRKGERVGKLHSKTIAISMYDALRKS